MYIYNLFFNYILFNLFIILSFLSPSLLGEYKNLSYLSAATTSRVPNAGRFTLSSISRRRRSMAEVIMYIFHSSFSENFFFQSNLKTETIDIYYIKKKKKLTSQNLKSIPER